MAGVYKTDMETAQPSTSSVPARFFRRPDWLAFLATTSIVFGVYLFTLAPEVTLSFSGVLATGAYYAGVPATPGMPLWTLYGWLFAHLLPFGNIAWRIGVSSAAAGALTCGVIALMVSRGGGAMLRGVVRISCLSGLEETWLRFVSGVVGGTIFGFHRSFWGQAVIVESTALAMLLFAMTLCLLLRWCLGQRRNRFLYAAAFVFGLTLTVEMQFAVALLGLLFIVLFRKPALGRDIFLALCLLLWAIILLNQFGFFAPELSVDSSLRRFYLGLAFYASFVTLIASLFTRGLLNQWRVTFVACFSFILPLSLYFYLPIASMTNPPMNWGYARTVEGFFRLITRGQYERLSPTTDIAVFLSQIVMYAMQSIRDVGWIELVPALFPFCFFHRMTFRARGWLMGLTATFLALSCFMVAMLNPSSDQASLDLVAVFFIPSHLILTLWIGFGLCLVGPMLGRKPPVLKSAHTA